MGASVRGDGKRAATPAVFGRVLFPSCRHRAETRRAVENRHLPLVLPFSIAHPPLLQKLPNVITSEQLGQAMLNAARFGGDKAVLEATDIKRLAEK